MERNSEMFYTEFCYENCVSHRPLTEFVACNNMQWHNSHVTRYRDVTSNMRYIYEVKKKSLNKKNDKMKYIVFSRLTYLIVKIKNMFETIISIFCDTKKR